MLAQLLERESRAEAAEKRALDAEARLGAEREGARQQLSALVARLRAAA